MSIHLDVCPPTCSLTLILLLFKLNCFINLIHSSYLCTFMVPAIKPTDKPIYNNFSAYCEILNFVLDSNHQWTMCKIWWWSGGQELNWSKFVILPSASTKLKGEYTGFTLSVCPSVDRIESALYLQQYSSDPFHIGTSYQATSEGVSRVMFVSKLKSFKFCQILKICNFDFVFFWLGIQYDSIVWIIMGRRVVSSERRHSSCSSSVRFELRVKNIIIYIFDLTKCVLEFPFIHTFNTLWPSDAIWGHKYESTLVQVIAIGATIHSIWQYTSGYSHQDVYQDTEKYIKICIFQYDIPITLRSLLTHWGRVTYICVCKLNHHWFI